MRKYKLKTTLRKKANSFSLNWLNHSFITLGKCLPVLSDGVLQDHVHDRD